MQFLYAGDYQNKTDTDAIQMQYGCNTDTGAGHETTEKYGT